MSSFLTLNSVPKRSPPVIIPVLFTLAYQACAVYCISLSVKRRKSCFVLLSVVCIVRAVAFVLDALNIDGLFPRITQDVVFIASVLYYISFVTLLCSVYVFLFEFRPDNRRQTPNESVEPKGRSISSRILPTAALILDVCLDLTGICLVDLSTDFHTQAIGNVLRLASAYLSLLVLALLSIRVLCFFFPRSIACKKEYTKSGCSGAEEEQEYHKSQPALDPEPGTYRSLFIILVAALLILLMMRGIAWIVLMGSVEAEILFYPLMALPELLAVIMFCSLGLFMAHNRCRSG